MAEDDPLFRAFSLLLATVTAERAANALRLGIRALVDGADSPAPRIARAPRDPDAPKPKRRTAYRRRSSRRSSGSSARKPAADSQPVDGALSATERERLSFLAQAGQTAGVRDEVVAEAVAGQPVQPAVADRLRSILAG